MDFRAKFSVFIIFGHLLNYSGLSLPLQSLSSTGSLTLSTANKKPLKLKMERSHVPLFTPPTAAAALSSHLLCCQSAAAFSFSSFMDPLFTHENFYQFCRKKNSQRTLTFRSKQRPYVTAALNFLLELWN